MPGLVVLNFCDSAPLARRMLPHIPATVGWTGLIDDAQAETFAAQFYRHLGAARALHTAMDDTTITVTARYPQLHKPVAFGARHTLIFPTTG
ncbi:hypothetical protein [Cryptosporangium sp. NPDC051539]|uniref:hypothetical protein n=1 Tax=Cryptosporangium sp. NPDC051539 TaxID=3363962 RepID=UPI0037BB4862